jgi:hypothetical protein
VVNLATDEPAHRHVEFEIHDVELGTAEERLADNVPFSRSRPGRQEALHHRLACGPLIGVCHTKRRRDRGAQVFHVLHHSFVARCLEVVGRVKAVSTTDQHQDGIGVCERRLCR